jgi:tetratricopeptide (TPR) repeat protein
VLHRDLKPANVFLCADGRVKLLDFGLAHLLGTQELKGAGTPGYMAPEQARGDEVDPRADVYAAGRVLGAMLGDPRPRRLDLVVRAATASDPDARPRDGTAWLEALRAARRALERPARARRLALFAGAFVVLGVVVAGLVTWRVWRKQLLVDDDGRVTVAVADFANETRDPDLDGLSGLLVHSLEQSRTARVLTRSRLWDLARAEGRADGERMDEPLAREIGRKGDVRVLLLASVRKLDDTYLVEMRALEPGRDEYLFTAREKAASKTEMVPLVERLAKRTLDSFRQAGAVADAGAGPTPAVTTSLEAYRHYFEGMRCLDRSSGPSQRCIPQLEKAVAIDPDFALAQFRIAQAGLWSGVPLATLKERMTSALRHRERLPPKERAWVEAFSAQLEGREDDAARLFRIAADVGLDDRHVQADAADFFQTRNEPEAALPYLRRAVALESVGGPSAIYLAIALAALDRRVDLETLARALETGPQVKGALVALTAARYSLGDRRGALASAQAAVAASTDDVERGEAEALLDRLRIVMGEPGVDEEARATCSTVESATVETVRGRHAEARRLLALGAIAGCPPPDAERAGRSFYFQALAADLLAGIGDPEAAWPHARRASDLNPLLAGSIAVQLAYAGDLEHAAELAASLPDGSPRRRTYDAVVRWRRGDRAGARAILEGLNGYSTVPPLAPPAFLLGELLSEMGEDERAVDVLRRYRNYYFVHLHCAAWDRPKSSFLLARSLDRLGRRDEARAVLDEQLTAWKDADPDIPMLVAAKELRARLAAP